MAKALRASLLTLAMTGWAWAVAACSSRPRDRDGSIGAPNIREISISLPTDVNDDWQTWAISTDRHTLYVAPELLSESLVVANLANGNVEVRSDIALAALTPPVLWQASQAAYIDPASGRLFRAAPLMPEGVPAIAMAGTTLARLSEANGRTLTLEVWCGIEIPTWSRQIAPPTRGAGIALSKDGTRVFLAEELEAETTRLTAFDCAAGALLWTRDLEFQSSTPIHGTHRAVYADAGAVWIGGVANNGNGVTLKIRQDTGVTAGAYAFDVTRVDARRTLGTFGVSTDKLWSAELLVTPPSSSDTSPLPLPRNRDATYWECSFNGYELPSGRRLSPPTILVSHPCTVRLLRADDSGGALAIQVVAGGIRVIDWPGAPQ